MKPELARYAKTLYQQMWFDSDVKHKIVLGKHNLDCSEQTRLDIYTNRENNQYNGIHMNNHKGKRAFTKSIISILSQHASRLGPRPRPGHSDNLNNSNKNNQMTNPKAKVYSQSSSIPVQNRFNVLGN